MHIEKRYLNSDPSIDRKNYRRFSFPIQYEIYLHSIIIIFIEWSQTKPSQTYEYLIMDYRQLFGLNLFNIENFTGHPVRSHICGFLLWNLTKQLWSCRQISKVHKSTRFEITFDSRKPMR